MNAAYDQPSFSPFKLFFWSMIALIVFVVMIMIGNVDVSKHAYEKHGTASVTVRECLEQRGPIVDWQNKETGRHARVCEVEPGKYGVDITEADGSPVTSFIKDKMQRLTDVLRYIHNQGYNPAS